MTERSRESGCTHYRSWQYNYTKTIYHTNNQPDKQIAQRLRIIFYAPYRHAHVSRRSHRLQMTSRETVSPIAPAPLQDRECSKVKNHIKRCSNFLICAVFRSHCEGARADEAIHNLHDTIIYDITQNPKSKIQNFYSHSFSLTLFCYSNSINSSMILSRYTITPMMIRSQDTTRHQVTDTDE